MFSENEKKNLKLLLVYYFLYLISYHSKLPLPCCSFQEICIRNAVSVSQEAMPFDFHQGFINDYFSISTNYF